LQIDHQCHNQDKSCAGGDTCPHRCCCNPAHLELATGRENVLRGKAPTARNAAKTHCPRGHAYDGIDGRKRQHRRCSTCRREQQCARRRAAPKRGRALGERHGNAKTTAADVRRMRELAAAGWSSTALGREFGLHDATVRKIVSRKAWPHVKDGEQP
jgi:hypothetical protein